MLLAGGMDLDGTVGLKNLRRSWKPGVRLREGRGWIILSKRVPCWADWRPWKGAGMSQGNVLLSVLRNNGSSSSTSHFTWFYSCTYLWVPKYSPEPPKSHGATFSFGSAQFRAVGGVCVPWAHSSGLVSVENGDISVLKGFCCTQRRKDVETWKFGCEIWIRHWRSAAALRMTNTRLSRINLHCHMKQSCIFRCFYFLSVLDIASLGSSMPALPCCMFFNNCLYNSVLVLLPL